MLTTADQLPLLRWVSIDACAASLAPEAIRPSIRRDPDVNGGLQRPPTPLAPLRRHVSRLLELGLGSLRHLGPRACCRSQATLTAASLG